MKSDNEEERIKNRVFDKFAKARIESKKENSFIYKTCFMIFALVLYPNKAKKRTSTSNSRL